jgi:TfoX/Sxy family transcriptional regulator of competence genes
MSSPRPKAARAPAMASGNPLADRVRAVLKGTAYSEKPMFGGICFLVNGHMTVAASKRGLLVRFDKDRTAETLKAPGTRPMMQRGRALDGYLHVDDAGTHRDADLKRWVQVALDHVRTLPAKLQPPAKTRRAKA